MEGIVTLFRIELGKVWRSRLAKVAMLSALLLGIASAVQNVMRYRNAVGLYAVIMDTKYFSMSAYGPFSNWAPVSILLSIPKLIFLVAPLLIALAYSWSLRAELRGGQAAQMMIRTSRGRYLAAKWLAVFLAGGLVAILPLVVNFLGTALFVPAYQPDAYDTLHIGMYTEGLMASLFFTNPLGYVVAKTALDFVLGGLWAAAVLGLSVLVRNRVAVVALPYVALYVVKYVWGRVFFYLPVGSFLRQDFTLFDQLSACGDSLGYGLGAVVVSALIMLAMSLLPLPFINRRGVL